MHRYIPIMMSKEESDKSLETVLGSLPDMIRARMEQLDEREKELEEMKRVIEQENPCMGEPSDVLRLNVGGTRIDVLRRTLMSVEGSMLAAKFSGRWDDSLEKDSDGNFFIDQPIELFLPVIDYLRSRACSTPGAPSVDSPKFKQPVMNRFVRMVKYYDMELGIYPYALFNATNTSLLVSEHPDYKLQADDWSHFLLLPLDGNACTKVKSFEVTLGKFTRAHVGWIDKNFINNLSADEKGVGYVFPSIAVDCGRTGICAFEPPPPGTRGTRTENFVAIDQSTKIDEGTSIRCEDKGNKWYIDGKLVASSSGDDGVARIDVPTLSNIVPCVSIKGSLRVSNIELEYK